MEHGSSLFEPDILLRAIHSLIKRLVERQSVVLEAIRDLRPDWILRMECDIDTKFSAAEWRKIILKYARTPQLGHWGNSNEWGYFLHGVGCRMTHTITGEFLDWDLGSLRTFHKSSFFYYVQWLIEQGEDNNALLVQSKLLERNTKLENLIGEAIDQLTNAGIVKPNQWGNKYTLIVE